MNPDPSARLPDTGPDLDEFDPQGVDLGTLEFCALQMLSHQEKQTVGKDMEVETKLIREKPVTAQSIDSKAIRSVGKPSDKDSDGRRDRDADWGVKTYRGTDQNGRLWERVKRWFGYKIHLIVDTLYEVPVGFEVTRASRSDTTRLLPMMERLGDRHEWVMERAEGLSGDKGYDSEENNRKLYDDYGIKPIISIRHDWKDGEETRSLSRDRVDNMVTDEEGSIFCVRQSNERCP